MDFNVSAKDSIPLLGCTDTGCTKVSTGLA